MQAPTTATRGLGLCAVRLTTWRSIASFDLFPAQTPFSIPAVICRTVLQSIHLSAYQLHFPRSSSGYGPRISLENRF